MHRLHIYIAMSCIIVGVLKALRMLLRVATSPVMLFQTVMLWCVTPVFVAWMIARPHLMGKLIILAFVLDIPFALGAASVETSIILLYACSALVVLQVLMTRRALFNSSTLPIAMRLYLGLAIMSYLLNPALPTFGVSGSGFRQYFRFFGGALALIVLPFVTPRRDFIQIPRLVFLAAIGGILIKLTVFFLLPSLRWVMGIPSAAMLTDGRFTFLALPGTMLFLSGLSIWTAWRRNPLTWPQWIVKTGTATGLIVISLSGTRALLIAAILTIVVLKLVRRQFASLALTATIAASAVLFVSNTSFKYPDFATPIVRSLSVPFLQFRPSATKHANFLSKDTWRWRQKLWTQAVRSTIEHPLTGRGFSGALWQAMQWRRRSMESFNYYIMQGELDQGATHNLFLGPFLTFGIPAGVCFLWYIFVRAKFVFRSALTRYADDGLSETNQFIAIWFCFFLISTTSTGGTVALYAFIACGMSHLLERYAREDETMCAKIDTKEISP
jgi:O-antigen ligase